MERVYFIKASKDELKFAAEAIDILMSQKVKLEMRYFLDDIEGLALDDINVCNTSCCIAGAHAIHFNKQSIIGGSYFGYLAKVGIEKNGYFVKFVLYQSWPANDIEHAIRRLRIVVDSGFIPCIGIVDASPKNINRYNPIDREWCNMRAEYHKGNILPLLEAKLDLLKSLKHKKNRKKPQNVEVFERRFFGVDI